MIKNVIRKIVYGLGIKKFLNYLKLRNAELEELKLVTMLIL